jgi:flagellar secretion chaperone FliS
MALAYSQRSARAYQRATVEAARPTQLILMLYDGAIRFLTIASEKFTSGEIEARHQNIVKAENILAELLGTIDTDSGLPLATNLVLLYEYMHRKLVEANLNDTPEPLAEVIGILREIRTAWDEADRASTPASAA